jgi:hypothetical protein
MLIYDMKNEKWVVLRPWMMYSSWHLTQKVTDEQWEEALKASLSEEEYAMILKGRNRNA